MLFQKWIWYPGPCSICPYSFLKEHHRISGMLSIVLLTHLDTSADMIHLSLSWSWMCWLFELFCDLSRCSFSPMQGAVICIGCPKIQWPSRSILPQRVSCSTLKRNVNALLKLTCEYFLRLCITDVFPTSHECLCWRNSAATCVIHSRLHMALQALWAERAQRKRRYSTKQRILSIWVTHHYESVSCCWCRRQIKSFCGERLLMLT